MKIDNKKLDIAIADACLTMNELSRQSRVSIVTLTKVRKGTQEPTPKTVGKIAKALNVSVGEIIQK